MNFIYQLMNRFFFPHMIANVCLGQLGFFLPLCIGPSIAFLYSTSLCFIFISYKNVDFVFVLFLNFQLIKLKGFSKSNVGID